jgi:hypothetical protein
MHVISVGVYAPFVGTACAALTIATIVANLISGALPALRSPAINVRFSCISVEPPIHAVCGTVAVWRLSIGPLAVRAVKGLPIGPPAVRTLVIPSKVPWKAPFEHWITHAPIEHVWVMQAPFEHGIMQAPFEHGITHAPIGPLAVRAVKGLPIGPPAIRTLVIPSKVPFEHWITHAPIEHVWVMQAPFEHGITHAPIEHGWVIQAPIEAPIHGMRRVM